MKVQSEQQAIQARCFHPSGRFIEFSEADVETSIPERFEKIAGQFPDRLAIRSERHSLTYRALNQAANRVAAAIRAGGAKADSTVALFMAHDAPLIAALLGVLKAGRVCVVLDPSHPKTRCGFLLKDSEACLIISDRDCQADAREYAQHGRKLICPDDVGFDGCVDSPEMPVRSDQLAMLIYTSGSTGEPKGVMQNHRNLLQDSRIYCNGLHLCSDDRVALLYSCSASQGIKITFAALLNGASLHLFDVRRRGIVDLGSWLATEGITVYFSVPILFRQFASTLSGHLQFPALRVIQLGSDAVTPRDVEEYRNHFSGGTILVVRFGTTESGTLRRMFFDDRGPAVDGTVPVGYETEGAKISIVDEAGKELALGAIGEIAVTSRYLSPGYWRRPELTRERFATQGDRRSERIYRTGDLGRIRSDGILYHHGRKDFQFQIRGYRIEAGEIEDALMVLDNVKEVVVAPARNSAGGETDSLVAYIVPRSAQPPLISDLRRAISKRLPSHMIPSHFVMLGSLPLTSNGKLDRKALPQLVGIRPEIGVPYAAPRNPVEQALANIWSDVLELDRVGIHDSFFDLGGHSLAATRIISRIMRSFPTSPPMRVLFEAPTVAEMAEVVGKQIGNGS